MYIWQNNAYNMISKIVTAHFIFYIFSNLLSGFKKYIYIQYIVKYCIIPFAYPFKFRALQSISVN